MRYEDKLRLIVERLNDEREMTVSYFSVRDTTRITIDEQFVPEIPFEDVWKILTKLSVENYIIEIDKDEYLDSHFGILSKVAKYRVEYSNIFDVWYKNYISGNEIKVRKNTENDSPSSISNWQGNFHWIDDNNYSFGGPDKIWKLKSKNTKTIGKMLIDNHDRFVLVSELTTKLNKSPKYVRDTIGHIRKKLPKIIGLISQLDDESEIDRMNRGAYKIFCKK